MIPACNWRHGPDFNDDGNVNGNDFLAWQRNVGRNNATTAQGDANGDRVVNAADLGELKQDFGTSNIAAAAALPPTADFNDDGTVSGDDFLMLQRGLVSANPSVAAGAVSLWKQEFGDGSQVALAATIDATESSSTAPSSAKSFALVASAESAGVSRTLPTTAVRSAFDASSLVDLAARAEYSAAASGIGLEPIAESDSRAVEVGAAAFAADAALSHDRAFVDLFGSRRRQGMRTEFEIEQSDDHEDSDEAFAALADHFERPLA